MCVLSCKRDSKYGETCKSIDEIGVPESNINIMIREIALLVRGC